MFEIRSKYKRGEVIMLFSSDWKLLELSRLVKSYSTCFVMYGSHAYFDGIDSVPKIVEDEVVLRTGAV